MNTILKVSAVFSVLLLASCAGVEPAPKTSSQGKYSFSHSDLDGDGALDYKEFKRFAHLEAAGQGSDAMNRRQAEELSGNKALHARFIFLDHNNDGRVSQSEMGQY